MYEPSREPVRTARSKIEHRCSRERNCIRGTAAAASIGVNWDGLGSYARRKQTRCECERVDAWMFCVDNAFYIIGLPEKKRVNRLPRTMNSTRRFTANFEMHASLAPGKRSCAPDEEITTI
jgi:hypothetical protein